MNKAFSWTSLFIILCTLLLVPLKSYSCADDNECHGDRICGPQGRCIYPDSDEAPPPPRASLPAYRAPQRDHASYCVTPYGSCPLAQALPVGLSCFCPSAFGAIAGIAQ